MARAILAADDALSQAMNALARRSTLGATTAARLAQWLAIVEVALMALLAVAGQRRSALRMLGADGLVYLACDLLGAAWPRPRPFARLEHVKAQAPHTPERSFPSRHVASALAMAAVGGRAHPKLGTSMAGVAWLLGVCRVAAGLHYPSDVLAGAVLGRAVGGLVQSARPTRPAASRHTRPSVASSSISSRLLPTARARSVSGTVSPGGRSRRSWTIRPR